MKTLFIFLLLISFTFFLRIYKIIESPPGFYSDESLTGYEAYSILKTGRDQYGNFLPITFKAFGDYRPGLFMYATVPFIAFFGLTEFAVRLPSAVFSTLTGLVIFFLSKELFKSEKAALFSMILFALSPWSLQFARMSHDTNLSTFLVILGIYFFLTGIKRKNLFLPFSAFLFALSLYVYYTTRVFVPLFGVSLLFLFKRDIFAQKKTLLLSFFIGLLVLIPLFLVLTNREKGWSRIDAVSLWSDPGIAARIIQSRQEDMNWYGRLFHNKFVDTTRAFAISFLSHFEPSFLLFSGDPVKLYNTPESGVLLWIEPFLLIIAGVHLWIRKNKHITVLCTWLVIGLLPDTLTRFYPAAARIHLVLPLVSILGGYGMFVFWQWTEKRKFLGTILKTVLVLCVGVNSLYFFHQHLVHTRVSYAKEWHYGVKEVAHLAQENENKFDTIWVSKSVWGWINFAFFQKYDPATLQKEIKLSEKNEYGLGWVYQMGKYYFDDLPARFDLSKNILYIAEPSEFPKEVEPLQIVYYPDRSKAFYLVSTENLKKIGK